MRAIILAAGKGKRLQSEMFDIPKVLRRVKGRALLDYVRESIDFIPEKDTVIVVGYKKEHVIENTPGEYTFVTQQEQLGTGHAVLCAKDEFTDYDGDVLVLYGDMPLIKRETYMSLIEKHVSESAACTILTAVTDNPLAYGRIIRMDGRITDIVEQRDCTPEQLKIRELNAGVYVFKSRLLFEKLRYLKNDNAQGEYYLTDVPKLLIADNLKVESYTVGNINEIVGVNTPEDLEFCEQHLDTGH
jgi:UDP-N-acetylglucosamine diphosphorylase/glucosamine-1-phosphate N-acetyltransferase